jgi:nucleoid-associated protein YgaU
MADRVKYFLLGLLFLVVAGVIAYDRWNAAPTDLAESGDDRGWEVVVGTQTPPTKPRELSVPPNPEEKPAKPKADSKAKAREPMRTEPPDEKQEPKPKAKPVVQVTPPPAPRKIHIIRAGETLESIALHYYKTRKGVQWIVEANKLKNPDRVYENQKLVIPARKVMTRKTTTKQPRATTPKTTKFPKDGRYTVKPHDGDLYAICRRFYGAKGEGARVARIMELNHLWSAEVKAGTVLILPPPKK